MRKALLVAAALLFSLFTNLSAQDIPQTDSSTTLKPINPVEPILENKSVYRIKKGIDYPLTIATAAWGIIGSQRIYNRDTIPWAEINSLNRKDINNLDRWVSYNYSKSAAKASDYFFIGSMPFPLILLFDKNIRRDGPKVGLLYLEAIGITSAVYVTAAMLADRHRPYAYNPDVDMSKRTRGGARNSFFAGHVAIVATSVFFTAQTYINYHPNMKYKWLLYTGAGLLASTTGYLRLKAGQHFLTDVVTGFATGTLSGLLVPYFHKIRHVDNPRLTIVPSLQRESSGFTLFYKLG